MCLQQRTSSLVVQRAYLQFFLPVGAPPHLFLQPVQHDALTDETLIKREKSKQEICEPERERERGRLYRPCRSRYPTLLYVLARRWRACVSMPLFVLSFSPACHSQCVSEKCYKQSKFSIKLFSNFLSIMVHHSLSVLLLGVITTRMPPFGHPPASYKDRAAPYLESHTSVSCRKT